VCIGGGEGGEYPREESEGGLDVVFVFEESIKVVLLQKPLNFTNKFTNLSQKYRIK
jgi:hypothetical protein